MAHEILSVAYQDVQPGDQIWDRFYYARDKWVTIQRVLRDGQTVSLATGTGDQYVGHAREGIGVRRDVTHD